MFQYENEITGKASIKNIWKLYADVSKWNLWDNSVSAVKLTDEFKTGAQGQMEMANHAILPFTITECTMNQSFTTSSKLGPVTVTFGHILSETKENVTITHTVTIEGGDEKQMEDMGNGITAGIPACLKSLLSLSQSDEII